MLFLSRFVVVVAGLAAAACGGSPTPATETTPGEARGDGDSSTAEVAASSDGADSASQPAVESSAAGDSASASGPDTGDDCIAFHFKMVECQKAESGLGASEEAEMRSAARDGCRDAYADRGNPVTAYVIELWSRCGQLSCAEIEVCFLSGMATLSAPPGPYVPYPQ